MDVAPAILLIGLAVSTVIGIAGALLLAWRIRNRQVRRGWAVIALGGCAAAAVSAWGWRVLTASYVIAGSTHIWLAIGAAAVAWAVVLVGSASYLRSVRDVSVSPRGCGYCAQEDNVRHGDVHAVSTNELRHSSLVQCPRCGWLYTVAEGRSELAVPISEAEARELFPSTW